MEFSAQGSSGKLDQKKLDAKRPEPSTGTLASSNDKQVRIVGLSEYKAAAYALAEAFADDHVSQYFVDTPDRKDWTEEQRWDLHVKIMEYITYAHILNGLVTTVGSDYGCISLWMPPGNNMDDLLTIIRSGLWRLYYKLSGEGKNRFFSEFFPLLHDTKASVLGPRDDDSYYLVYIGTRPAARGKGYARACIDHMTKKADAEGRPCYLESSNDINPIIYGKHGFKKVKKIYLQRAEEPIELDIMVREPIRASMVVLPASATKQAKSVASDSKHLDHAMLAPTGHSPAAKVKVQISATGTTKAQGSGDMSVTGAAKALKTYAVVKTDAIPAAFSSGNKEVV